MKLWLRCRTFSMASLCLWIFLFSELCFSQATLKQLASPADKTMLCRARSDVLIQCSVLTPVVSAQHSYSLTSVSLGARLQSSCRTAKSVLVRSWRLWLLPPDGLTGARPVSSHCAAPPFLICTPQWNSCFNSVKQAQPRIPTEENML